MGLQLHISPAETSYLEKVAFSVTEGENESNVSLLLTPHELSPIPLNIKQIFLHQVKNKNDSIGDKRFLDTRLQTAVLLFLLEKVEKIKSKDFNLTMDQERTQMSRKSPEFLTNKQIYNSE